MRVALVVHCFFPDHFYGTETYTLALARNLLRLDHDPVVISAIFAGEPKQPQLINHYEYAGIPVYAFDKNYFPNTRVKDTYYQPDIREIQVELLKQIRPDIVHVTHLINHTGVLLEAADSLKIPIVATFTDFFGFCYNNKLEAADGSLCDGPNARRTNCLACYNKATSEQPAATRLVKFSGLPLMAPLFAAGMERASKLPGFRRGSLAGRVLDITQRPDTLAACYQHYRAAIVPTRLLKNAYLGNGFKLPMHEIRFGVDLPRQPKSARPQGAPIRFGFIGQLAMHKGVDILLEAFCRLPARSAELHIYGASSQYPDYASALKSRAGDLPVFFNGTFPSGDMARILAGIDFLVIPSRWFENSPLALLYSLASCTPVIVANVDGLTEFVEPGVNGWIFNRGSADDLERVLKAIIAAPEASRNVAQTTEYLRTTAMMAEDVLAVYESVMIESSEPDYSLGCRLPLRHWSWLNRTGAFEHPELMRFVSPLPPAELMKNVSGLESARDFASHGADIFAALSAVSPRPLTEYEHILDFGCGCGRLARLFKGHPHKVSGCDIDLRHVDWVRANLDHMQVKFSSVRPPLPFEDDEFDAIISISVFTHLNEPTQDSFLADLHRICRPGGMLFLTIHGEHALKRVVSEPQARAMVDVPEEPFRQARERFARGEHAFILQRGHLTTMDCAAPDSTVIFEPYEYGISFTPEEYVRRHWSQWFDVLDCGHGGAIHSFQDIVVLRAKPKARAVLVWPDETVAAIRSELAEKRAAVVRQQHSIAAMRNELEARRAAFARQEVAVAAMRGELEEKRVAFARQEENIAEMRREFALQEKNIAEMRRSFALQKRSIAALRSELWIWKQPYSHRLKETWSGGRSLAGKCGATVYILAAWATPEALKRILRHAIGRISKRTDVHARRP